MQQRTSSNNNNKNFKLLRLAKISIDTRHFTHAPRTSPAPSSMACIPMSRAYDAAVTVHESDNDETECESDGEDQLHPRRRRAKKAFASVAGVGDENATAARRGVIMKRRDNALRVTGPLLERRDAQAHEIETEVETEPKASEAPKRKASELPSPHLKWVRLVKAEETIATADVIADRKPPLFVAAPKPRIVKFNWSQPKPSPIVVHVALITTKEDTNAFVPVSSVAASSQSATKTGPKPLVAPIALQSSASSPRVVSLSPSGPTLVTPTSSSLSLCTPRRAARQWRSDDDLESDSDESDGEGDLA